MSIVYEPSIVSPVHIIQSRMEFALCMCMAYSNGATLTGESQRRKEWTESTENKRHYRHNKSKYEC